MGIEASKEENHEKIVIELGEFEHIDFILSKVIIPFSEVIATSNAPDIYSGHEKIPFVKRYPLYKTIMRQEFADTIKIFSSEDK